MSTSCFQKTERYRRRKTGEDGVVTDNEAQTFGDLVSKFPFFKIGNKVHLSVECVLLGHSFLSCSMAKKVGCLSVIL